MTRLPGVGACWLTWGSVSGLHQGCPCWYFCGCWNRDCNNNANPRHLPPEGGEELCRNLCSAFRIALPFLASPLFTALKACRHFGPAAPTLARQQELAQPKLQKPSETMPTLPDFHSLLFVGLVLTKGPHTCWLARC